MIPSHALQAILRILKKVTENICGRVTFKYSYKRRVIGHFELLKSSTTKSFSEEFSKTFKTEVFLDISWKMHEVVFYKRLVSRSNPVTSIKWRHRAFSGKRSTIWEHSKKKFSLEYVFAEVGNTRLQVWKRDSFVKIFFCNLRHFRAFISVHFQKGIT